MPAEVESASPSPTDLQRRIEELTAENSRLRAQAGEALEQQTAMAEVLEVINSSPGNLMPVLDAMLDRAVRLTGSAFGIMNVYEEGGHRAVALHGVPDSLVEQWSAAPESGPGDITARFVEGEDVVQIEDLEVYVSDWPGALRSRALVEISGARSLLAVALRKDGKLLGSLTAYRREVRPFTGKQVALLQSFAGQAVIAMENAQLITETREALEQQTATSAILRIISQSPSEVRPVFDVVVSAAVRLCGAQDSLIVMLDGSEVVFEAHEGAVGGDRGDRLPLDRENAMGRAIIEGRTVHIPDVAALGPGEFTSTQQGSVRLGFRAIVAAPLMREGSALGALLLRKPDPGPFTPRQISLLETFASQAVIAIENVRLFTELGARNEQLREALEQQTATAEILHVISQSPTDIAPVLDAVARAALRFCNAEDASVCLRDGAVWTSVAHHGTFTSIVGERYPLDRQSIIGRTILDGRPIHVSDTQALDPAEWPVARALTGRLGVRTHLAVPLLRRGVALGTISLRRPVPGGFTNRQVEMAETFAAQAVIAIENVRLFTELSDSLERQTATADILRVISQSPTDVVPVLTAVAKAALKFCGARDAQVVLRDGDTWSVLAHEGPIGALPGTRRLSRQTVGGRAMVDGKVVQIADLQAEGDDFQEARELGQRLGFRSALAAPLLRDDVAIGAISLRRPEAGAFTANQVEFLESFADQAVIAIQNARLFSELRDALEQQTATADILKAIASSPTDVQPVLDAVAKAALRFCGAPDAIVWLRDGDDNVVAAHEGTLTASIGMRRPMSAALFSGQAMLEGRTRQIADVDALDATAYAGVLALARQHKWRASAAAPMMHDGKAIGCVVLRKPEPGLLSPRQIALLETFAAQAVIAIENVRLFTELREALEQQSATSDVLKVIASSPTNVQPVLDAVAKAAQRFCGAADAVISLREGDEFIRAAHEGSMPFVQGRNVLDRSSISGRAIVDARTIHVPDLRALHADDFATSQTLAVGSGALAALAAPMLREGVAIGCVLLRRTVVGPFGPKQIELLEAFAAQAVIAIENVRLFTELRESLQRQTATTEVLETINASPGDLMPVFEAILARAMRLCDAAFGTFATFDGQRLDTVATRGVPEAFARFRRAHPPAYGPNTGPGRLIAGEDLVHEIDVADSEAYRQGDPSRRAIVELGGARTILNVALRNDGVLLGAMSIYRQEVLPFRDNQIALLRGFAAQAVIAMENARLLTEQREALERQTATADILKVIASSPADMKPAFDAIAENANRLLGGLSTTVWRLEGEAYRLEAFTPTSEEADRALRAMAVLPREQGDTLAPAAAGRSITEIPDTESGPLFMREIARLRGFRACLAVSLAIEGQSIGFVNVTRREPGVFRPEDVELLKTFADQAVIAIQNARLFSELREALDQQTATAEILRAISQSPTDVQPVLDAVVKAAVRFCGATDAIINLRHGDGAITAAHDGALGAVPGRLHALDRETGFGRAILDGQTCHFPDIEALDAAEFATSHRNSSEFGFRASVAAPLMREGTAIGAVSLRKLEPGPFAPQQIALLETFAAQAVIAIENVRLFTELRDSLERLKAAQANLVQSEKMASLGQLTAGIAHEIKNPLNFVNNFAALSVELLGELQELAAPALPTLGEERRIEVEETMALLTGNLGKIVEHGKRADGIVRSMLSHSRGGTGDWQASNINALVEEALNLAYHGARAQDPEFNVTLERDLAATGTPIELVPQDVTRVFLNLIGNGFYATRKRRQAGNEPGWRPTLKIATRDLGEAVEVRVRDNGTGILPQVRAKLFQPFFTTKPTGEGTGLGLSISWDIVAHQHGGTIEVESEPGAWTEFTVRLPRRERSAGSARGAR